MLQSDILAKGIFPVRNTVRMLLRPRASLRARRSHLRGVASCDAAAKSGWNLIKTCEGVHK